MILFTSPDDTVSVNFWGTYAAMNDFDYYATLAHLALGIAIIAGQSLIVWLIIQRKVAGFEIELPE